MRFAVCPPLLRTLADRQRVTVRAEEDTVAAAIRRTTARFTGLPERLRDG